MKKRLGGAAEQKKNPKQWKYQEQDLDDLDVEVQCLDGTIYVSLLVRSKNYF